MIAAARHPSAVPSTHARASLYKRAARRAGGRAIDAVLSIGKLSCISALTRAWGDLLTRMNSRYAPNVNSFLFLLPDSLVDAAGIIRTVHYWRDLHAWEQIQAPASARAYGIAILFVF